MLKPNDCSRLSLEDLKLYRRFLDLSTCLSELVTRFTDPKRPSQYQFGIGSLDLNNFEWYKFLKFLDNRDNMDNFERNKYLLFDADGLHPEAVVQFIPYMIPQYLSRIHDHLFSDLYRDAYRYFYSKIEELKEGCVKQHPHSKPYHICQTIFSMSWILENLDACFSKTTDIDTRSSITVFSNWHNNADHSKNVEVQIQIDAVRLQLMRKAHTIVNAMYNVFQTVVNGMNWGSDNSCPAIYGHFQVQLSRTIIRLDDVREEVELMQSDLQKIFKYFTANATIPELAEVLDTCLNVACGQRPGYKPVNNLIAELNTAEYRALSTFSKLLNQRVLPKRGGWCSFELPYLHQGLSHSEYCDEVQKNKYYQSIRKKMEGTKTFDAFIARINNDKKYYFKIDLFRCKEWDLVVPEQVGVESEQVGVESSESVNEYPGIFHFHLNLERPKLDLKLIQDVIAQYFAIVEYLTARYGLVEFYCYGDCSYVKPFKLQAEDKSEINRALFKAFVGSYERVRTLFGLTEELAKEKDESESSETNSDTNPF